MSEQPAQIPPCAICLQPLSADELNLSRRWHFDCEKCSVCGQSMSGATTMINKCLDSGKPVAHTTCASMRAIEELRTHVLPIEQKHLDEVNTMLLEMRHAVKPPSTDLELLRNYLIKIQETAATVSYLIKLTKDKIDIANRDDYEEVLKERKKVERAAKAIKAESEQQTAERSAMLSAERNNPFLRDKRKSIEGVMKMFGFDLQSATQMIEDQIRKSGKDPATGQPIQ